MDSLSLGRHSSGQSRVHQPDQRDQDNDQGHHDDHQEQPEGHDQAPEPVVIVDDDEDLDLGREARDLRPWMCLLPADRSSVQGFWPSSWH